MGGTSQDVKRLKKSGIVTPYENIMYIPTYIVSVLGREEGYTVTYTPPPEGLLKAEGYI